MLDNKKIEFNGKEYEIYSNDAFALKEVMDLKDSLDESLNKLYADKSMDNVYNTLIIVKTIVNKLTDNKFDEIYGECKRNVNNLLKFVVILVESLEELEGDVADEYIN